MITLEQLIYTVDKYQHIELYNYEGSDTLVKMYEGTMRDLFDIALANSQEGFFDRVRLATPIQKVIPNGTSLEVYIKIKDIRY